MAYPPGKKVRSLSARGPFDSLIFYYDLTFVPEDFLFYLVGVEGGLQLFCSLNVLIII